MPGENVTRRQGKEWAQAGAVGSTWEMRSTTSIRIGDYNLKDDGDHINLSGAFSGNRIMQFHCYG
jgi:hypothetical protein